jgi:hypothetical protein
VLEGGGEGPGSPPGRTPLLQVFSSLTGGEGGGGEGMGGAGDEEEEELEEAEEDAAELLALAATWSSMQSNGGGGGDAGGGTPIPMPMQPPPPAAVAGSRTAGVAAVADLMLAIAFALRRLAPLLLLAGGLPWLFHHHHHHHDHATPHTPPTPLALLVTAVLRQCGVALAAPRSRALRRAAFLLNVGFLVGATLVLLWTAYRCVVVSNRNRRKNGEGRDGAVHGASVWFGNRRLSLSLSLFLEMDMNAPSRNLPSSSIDSIKTTTYPRPGLGLASRRNANPTTAATTTTTTQSKAADKLWVQVQWVETRALPLLLWLYGEGRRAYRRYLRRRRRWWEEWGYMPSSIGGVEMDKMDAAVRGGKKIHAE